MKKLSPLLKDTWNFYRQNIYAICFLVFPFVIPVNILYAVLQSFIVDTQQVYLIAVMFSLLFYPVYHAVLILYVSSVLSGDYLSPVQYYKTSLKFWRPLMVFYVISVIALACGLVLFVFPALIVAARLAFAEFYCVLYSKNPLEAFSNSWKQTKECQWLLLSGVVVISLFVIIPVHLLERSITALYPWSWIHTFIFGVVDDILYILPIIFCFRIFTAHQENHTKENT